MSTLTIVVLTAVLSSFFTLLIFLVSFKLFLGKRIDETFNTKMDEATDKIEQRIKSRLVDMFTDVSSDIIKDRAINAARVAKNGAGKFEDKVSSFVNRLANAADTVLTPPDINEPTDLSTSSAKDNDKETH